MIARIWKGGNQEGDYEEVSAHLKATVLKDYDVTRGNLGYYVLTRQVGRNTELLLLPLWRSMDDIKGFAGEDVEKAVYPPVDNEFILDLAPTVDHYEIGVAP